MSLRYVTIYENVIYMNLCLFCLLIMIALNVNISQFVASIFYHGHKFQIASKNNTVHNNNLPYGIDLITVLL